MSPGCQSVLRTQIHIFILFVGLLCPLAIPGAVEVNKQVFLTLAQKFPLKNSDILGILLQDQLCGDPRLHHN